MHNRLIIKPCNDILISFIVTYIKNLEYNIIPKHWKVQKQFNNLFYSVEPENSLLLNFKDVLQLFEDDAFWDTFGKAIEEKYPGVKESLRDRMKDLENNECEIVIAGNVFDCTLIQKKKTKC